MRAGAPTSTLQPSNLGASDGAPRAVFDQDGVPPPHRSGIGAAFGKRIRRQESNEMLELSMFLGLGAVAVWAYCRYPRLRPRSILRAIAHVAVSFAGFALLPATLSLLVPLLPSHDLQPYLAVGLLIPGLTYVLLSWVWLIARILHDLFGGTPRGGHPADTTT